MKFVTYGIHIVDLEIRVDRYTGRHHVDVVHMYHHLYMDLVHIHDLIRFNWIRIFEYMVIILRSHRLP